jgi:alpha-tubulin suppressor-like RCC1 family protein
VRPCSKGPLRTAPGDCHAAVWIEAGELFTFGDGDCGQLGHGGTAIEYVPRLVEALVAKKVVGAAAGHHHGGCQTQAWEESSSPP